MMLGSIRLMDNGNDARPGVVADEPTDPAVRDGVDVRRYFAWSLLDNDEWAEGCKARFGIVHVDFATQRRTLKSSGRWYAQLIKAHRQTRGT